MYQLTCPACQHRTRSPFVRVGATAACAGCGQVFTVSAEHLRRLVRASDADHAGLVLPESPYATSRPSVREPAGPAIRPEPVTPAPTPAPARPRIAASTAEPTRRTKTSAGPQVQPARPGAARRRLAAIARERDRYLVIWLGLITVGLLLGLWVGLWYGMSRAAWRLELGTTHSARSEPAEDPGAADEDRTKPAQTAVASRLEAGAWQTADEPPDANAKGRPVPLDSPDWSPADAGNWRCTAPIVTDRFGLFESASLHVALVGRDEQLVARTDQPLVLFGGPVRQQLSVVVPADLRDRTTAVRAWVSTGQPLGEGLALEDAQAHADAGAEANVVTITGTSRSARVLRRTIVLLRAEDGQGRQVAAWRVEWDQPVQPGQSLQIVVPVPVDPRLNIDAWRVDAVGEAGGADLVEESAAGR